MYSKEELVELLKNPNEFSKENDKRCGYLVKLTKEYGIEIDETTTNVLMASRIGCASLGLKIKNKDEITSKDFENNNFNEESKLSEKDIWSVDFINKNSQKIIDNISRNGSSSQIYHSLYEILHNSLSNLSIEDFLKINKEILYVNPTLLSAQRNNSNDIRIKSLIKECNIENAKKEDYLLTPIGLPFYQFTKEDEPFLIELLNNQLNQKRAYFSDYSYNKICRKVNGFANLISKEDYTINYAPFEVYELSDDFFNQNIDILKANFQKYYLQKNDNNSRVFDLHSILNAENILPDRLDKLLDQDFFINYFNNIKKYGRIGLRLGGVNPRPSFLENCINVYNKILSLPEENLMNVDPYEIISTGQELVDHLKDPQFKEVSKMHLNQLKSNIESYTIKALNYGSKNENVSFLMGELEYFLEEEPQEQIDNIIKNAEPSINLFSILCDTLSSNRQKLGKKEEEIKETLSDSIVSLYNTLKPKEENTLNLILKTFNISYVLENNKENLTLFKQKINTSHNITNWELIGLNNIDDRAYSLLCALDKRVYNEIKNNITLKEDTFNTDFLFASKTQFLSDEKDYNTHIDFLKGYIFKHKESLESDPITLNHLLTHTEQSKIYPFVNEDSQNQHFNKLLESLRTIKSLDRIKSDISSKFPKEYNYFEKNKFDIEGLVDSTLNLNTLEEVNRENVNDRLSLIEKCLKSENEKIYNIYDLFSTNYINNKIINLLANNDYSTIESLYSIRRNIKKDSFILTVNNLNKEELQYLSKNESFINLILESIDYNGNTEIELRPLDYKTLSTLIEKIEFNPKSKTSKYLNIFRKSEKQLKKYLITNKPDVIMSNMNYLMYRTEGKNYYFSKDSPKPIITEPYNESEIIDIFQNMKENDLYFKNFDINARNTDNYSELYSGRTTEEDISNKISKVLDNLKDTNKIPYLITLLDTKVMSDHLSVGLEKGRRDETYHRAFHKIANLESVIESIDEVLNKISDNPFLVETARNKYNTKLLTQLIVDFTYATHYEEEINCKKHESLYNFDESVKIVNKLFDKEPLFTISNIKNIGKIDSVSNYIIDNIEKYYDSEKLIEIFLPTNSLEYGLNAKYREERFLNIANNFVEKAIEKEDIEHLKYLSYIVNLESTSYFGDEYEKGINIEIASDLLSSKDTEALDVIVNNTNMREKLQKSIEIIKLNKELNVGSSKTTKKMKI